MAKLLVTRAAGIVLDNTVGAQRDVRLIDAAVKAIHNIDTVKIDRIGAAYRVDLIKQDCLAKVATSAFVVCADLGKVRTTVNALLAFDNIMFMTKSSKNQLH